MLPVYPGSKQWVFNYLRTTTVVWPFSGFLPQFLQHARFLGRTRGFGLGFFSGGTCFPHFRGNVVRVAVFFRVFKAAVFTQAHAPIKGNPVRAEAVAAFAVRAFGVGHYFAA